MKPHSPARKALVLLTTFGIAGLAVWVGARKPLVSGTKSTFTAVTAKAVPGGGPAAATTAATSSTTGTKTTSGTSTPPGAGGW